MKSPIKIGQLEWKSVCNGSFLFQPWGLLQFEWGWTLDAVGREAEFQGT